MSTDIDTFVERADEGALRFALLGPLRVSRGGEDLDLGPRQQQAVLALLLVHANRPVTYDELMAMLWPTDPPASATNILHRYVSSLRRLMEPDLPPRESGSWLRRQGGAYRLRADARTLDLLRFREYAARARGRAGEDPRTALPLYAAALELWAGPVAAGLEPLLGALPVFAGIAEEFSSAVLEAADAALSVGKARVVLAALRTAAERNPWDERIRARLLLLLAAEGKQAEAVSGYRDLRRRLAEDLGVNPGAELRSAYERVLRQDTAPTPVARTPKPPAPKELPPRLPIFIGHGEAVTTVIRRFSELRRGRMPILVVRGTPGVGKTAFANHVAHAVAEEFPDGQLFARPHPTTAHAPSVLRHFAQALSAAVPEGENMPALVGAYRTLMSDRKVLLVFDDVRDGDELLQLLPDAPGCAVILTSRDGLAGFVAATGASVLTIDRLNTFDARRMLLSRVGDPDCLDPEAVDDIVAACGGLPVAIASVAARIAAGPDFALEAVRRELADEANCLDVFTAGIRPREVNEVRAAFTAAYTSLTVEAARLFRLLPTAPGPDISAGVCASFAGLPPKETASLLDELAAAGLVREHRPRRYELPRLQRAYAVECAAAACTADERAVDERRQAFIRLLDHLLQTAVSANKHISSQPPRDDVPAPLPGVTPESLLDVKAATSWFAAELDTILASVRTAEASDAGPVTWQLPLAVYLYCQRDTRYAEWRELAELGLAATIRRGDRLAEAHVRRCLSGAYNFLGDWDEAEQQLLLAAEVFEREHMALELAHVNSNLSTVALKGGRLDEAMGYERAAAELFDAVGHLKGLANARWGMGHISYRMGRFDDADRLAEAALEIFARIEDPNGRGVCCLLTAMTAHIRGDLAKARSLLRRAISFNAAADNRNNLIEAQIRVGLIELEMGDRASAGAALRQALAIMDVGTPLPARSTPTT